MDQATPSDIGRGAEIRAALRDITPVAVAAVPIGTLFGAIAVAKGLSAAEVTLMSALVFAGGAQFAAIEIWAHPAPLAALAFSTLLINARHVLMAASLGPKMRASWARKLVGFGLITDETWALAERRFLEQPVTALYWFTMSLTLMATWVTATAVGAVLGSFLGDPERIGADFAFTALFIGLIAGFGRARVTVITVATSGAVAAIVYRTLGTPWHVLAGAAAGIAAAYLASPREARP